MSRKQLHWPQTGLCRLVLAFGATLASLPAAVIVGYDSVEPGGLFYSINSLTGSVTPVGPGFGIAMSSGPAANTILYSSPLNTYELNVQSGDRKLYACMVADLCPPVGDHAFDGSARVLYALGQMRPPGAANPSTALFRLMDSGLPVPGVPDSTTVSYSLIGQLGVEEIDVIEYVPGVGLIGTDGYSALYRIDAATGAASLLTPLFIVLPEEGDITPMNGLAWDPDTGRLLGSAPLDIGPGGIGMARLYNVDISSGMTTWLNEAPPSLTGIATVTPVPEPATIATLPLALIVVASARRKLHPRR